MNEHVCSCGHPQENARSADRRDDNLRNLTGQPPSSINNGSRYLSGYAGIAEFRRNLNALHLRPSPLSLIRAQTTHEHFSRNNYP
jgi:hypothetical protein